MTLKNILKSVFVFCYNFVICSEGSSPYTRIIVSSGSGNRGLTKANKPRSPFDDLLASEVRKIT